VNVKAPGGRGQLISLARAGNIADMLQVEEALEQILSRVGPLGVEHVELMASARTRARGADRVAP